MAGHSWSSLHTCMKMNFRKPAGTWGCADKNKSLYHQWSLFCSLMNVTFGNILKIAFFFNFQKYVFNFSTYETLVLLQHYLRFLWDLEKLHITVHLSNHSQTGIVLHPKVSIFFYFHGVHHLVTLDFFLLFFKLTSVCQFAFSKKYMFLCCTS